MKLSALESSPLLSVGPSDAVDKAISLMDEHGFHHLPVLEAGRVVGIVSDRDLLVAVGWLVGGERRQGLGGGDPAEALDIAHVMSHPVETLSPDQGVEDAARVMVEHKIGAVVVSRDKTPLGIVTSFDLLSWCRGMSEGEVCYGWLSDRVDRHMRANVFTAKPGDTIQSVFTMMHRKHFRHVPVVAHDDLLGIITDRDIRREVGTERIYDANAEEAGRDYVPPSLVHEIMSTRVIALERSWTLLEAAETMAGNRIGGLPVIEDKRMVGIITDTDILRLIAQNDGLSIGG